MHRSFIVALATACPCLLGCAGNEGTAGGSADGGRTDGARDAGEAADSSANLRCTGEGGGMPYSKYKWAFVGNLHQHTVSSLDAYSFGTRATPADAYLFAKGMTVITIGTGTTAVVGPTVKIDRPLDFLAVTDHSEWLGAVKACQDTTSPFYDSTDCKLVRSTKAADQRNVFRTLGQITQTLCTGSGNEARCIAEQRTAWEDEQTAAANANDPCHFTSLIAYEWTSSPDKETNHRNVFFSSSQVPSNPLDSYTFTTTSELFSGLDKQCTGACSALVVPHNTNRSAGTSLVLPSSPGDLAQMQKYQRLVEIYQHKGSSECYYDPAHSSADPECAFEYLDPGAPTDTQKSYVRTALRSGIEYSLAHASANPFELGIIASTDDHDGTAGFVQESTYSGHSGRLDDTPARRLVKYPERGSGGLAFLWAEQNTRDAIFAALMRRETYATSGPRITVRFYETSSTNPCTADFPNTIIDANDAVPMGSTFRSSDVKTAPRFAIAAWPDTLGQPLANGTTAVAGIATVQVIKAHGKAGSTAPSVVQDPPIDVPMASSGACVTWSDPSFDPTEQAFYYVRALQVPTWRWSHFACASAPKVAGCGPGGTLDVTIQERAWTSPIWYVP